MTDTKMKSVPKVRFEGFTDDWEERKLGDIVVFLNGRAYKQAELLDSGKYPVLRVGNFNTNDKWYYSDLELPAKNYADKGDLLYTWATAFGPHIWKGPKVIYHYHIWKVETTSDISKNFAVHLLDADQAQMTNSLNGSTMVHITKGTMENKIVTIPGISEQRNMARLLDQLDCTIALHQRKHDSLLKLKQAYLQKMFPKNGQKTPELRFGGFTDDWEQLKLSDLTESHNSGVYIPKDQYGEGTNIIGVGDIYDSDVVDGQRYRLAPVKDKRFILHTNDLLYGESSLVPEGIARVVSVSEAGAGTAFAWHTRRFKVNQVTLNSRFLGLELDYWFPARSHLMRISTKTALTGITTQDFFNTQIVFPSKQEQEKIATLINSLDTAIALHQQQLDNLKQLKKWALQNLFV